MSLRLGLLPVAMLLAAPATAQVPLPGVPVSGVPTRDILRGTLEAGRDALPEIDPKLLEIHPECERWLLQQELVTASPGSDVKQPGTGEDPAIGDGDRDRSPAEDFGEEGCALYAATPQPDEGTARLGIEYR